MEEQLKAEEEAKSKLEQEEMDKLIELKLNEGRDFWDFEGDDYCQDCSGWDGKSKRCECGNRRVCWSKDWAGDLYPEAY